MGVSLELLGLMAVYSFVTSVSPGPNNTILLTLSARFGVRGAIPHLLGMVIGLSVMVIAMSAGLGAFFAAYPAVYEVLKYAGFAYVLYMAWRIYRAAIPEPGSAGGKPATIWGSTVFQWVNPKAWIVIATFVTAYVPVELGALSVGIALAMFIGFTMPGATIWVFVGTLTARWLRTERAQRVFTAVMALALVASMVPVLFL